MALVLAADKCGLDVFNTDLASVWALLQTSVNVSLVPSTSRGSANGKFRW